MRKRYYDKEQYPALMYLEHEIDQITSAIRRLRYHTIAVINEKVCSVKDVNILLAELTAKRQDKLNEFNLLHAELYGTMSPISRLKSDIENILNLNKD